MCRHSVFFGGKREVASIYSRPYKTADISGNYLFQLALSHRAGRLEMLEIC